MTRISSYIFACGIAAFSTVAVAQELPVGTQLPDGGVITGYGANPKGPTYITTTGPRDQKAVNTIVERAAGKQAAANPAAAQPAAAKPGELPIGSKTANGAVITGYGVGPKGNPVYLTTQGEQLQSAVNSSVAAAKATATPASLAKKPNVPPAPPTPVAVKAH